MEVMTADGFKENLAFYPLAIPATYPSPLHDECSALMINRIWRYKYECIEYTNHNTFAALMNVMQFFYQKASQNEDIRGYYLAQFQRLLIFVAPRILWPNVEVYRKWTIDLVSSTTTECVIKQHICLLLCKRLDSSTYYSLDLNNIYKSLLTKVLSNTKDEKMQFYKKDYFLVFSRLLEKLNDGQISQENFESYLYRQKANVKKIDYLDIEPLNKFMLIAKDNGWSSCLSEDQLEEVWLQLFENEKQELVFKDVKEPETPRSEASFET